MNHVMRLDGEYFDMIKNGIKTVEYRLNDEKRQQIKKGDMITFYKRPLEEEMLNVEVIDLKYYKNLLDMYTDTFNNHLKDLYNTPQEVVEDTTFYTQEEINKYGCIAIFIKKLD